MNGFVPDWRGAFTCFGLTSLLILGIVFSVLVLPDLVIKFVKRRWP